MLKSKKPKKQASEQLGSHSTISELKQDSPETATGQTATETITASDNTTILAPLRATSVAQFPTTVENNRIQLGTAVLTGNNDHNVRSHDTPQTGTFSDRVAAGNPFSANDFEIRKERWQTLAQLFLLTTTMFCVLPVIGILGFLTVKAWPALSWEFLLTNPTNHFTAGGIWSSLIGTFCLVLCSLLVATPIGVLAGIYLNEYARDNWTTRIINLAVVNLAGVPSIVHALFGVGAFVYFMGMGRSLLAAACTVAVMTLPVIITSTREALAAVPMSFREACWSLGASRWQTIRTLVLPNSIAGILTGVILQVARAAGETAPILFTGAVLYVAVPEEGWQSFLPYGLHDRFMALAFHLYALATQIRGVSEASMYATAVVLIGLVLAVNSFSIGLRIYLRSQKKW